MTTPTDPWEDGRGFEARHLRAIIGVLEIIASIAVIGILIGKNAPVTREHLIAVGLLIGTGLLLLDPTSLLEVLGKLGAKLPWGGSK